MSDAGMPKNRGKKPRSARKASLKSSTKSIRSVLDKIGNDQRTPRINVKKHLSAQSGTLKKKRLSAQSDTSFSLSTPQHVSEPPTSTSLHPSTSMQFPAPPPLHSHASVRPPPPLLQPLTQSPPASMSSDIWSTSPTSLVNAPFQVSTPLDFSMLRCTSQDRFNHLMVAYKINHFTSPLLEAIYQGVLDVRRGT